MVLSVPFLTLVILLELNFPSDHKLNAMTDILLYTVYFTKLFQSDFLVFHQD